MMQLDTIVCSDALDFMRGLPPQSIDLIATDMPYGTTNCAWDIRVDLDHWWECVRHVLKPRGVFLTTASEPFASLLRVSNLDWYKYDWVWEKVLPTGFLDAPKKPLKIHEVVLIFYNGKINYIPQFWQSEPYKRSVAGKLTTVYNFYKNLGGVSVDGLRYPISIIRFSNANQTAKHHPTQKPVALYEYLIKTYTQPGDVVLDPFIGSGTTGLAALKTGRHYVGCDSSQAYVDLANQRIANADPYQPTTHTNGAVQLSLFGEAE